MPSELKRFYLIYLSDPAALAQLAVFSFVSSLLREAVHKGVACMVTSPISRPALGSLDYLISVAKHALTFPSPLRKPLSFTARTTHAHMLPTPLDTAEMLPCLQRMQKLWSPGAESSTGPLPAAGRQGAEDGAVLEAVDSQQRGGHLP